MRLRTIVGALSLGALVVAPSLAQASSHREAPFISKNPKVDATDFYMFESYETGRAGFVTMIANYQPLQDAYGGPNYFALDPDALYEIEIDNNGDAVEDLTFQFQFSQALGGTTAGAGISLAIGLAGNTKNVAVPFYNVGLIPGMGGVGNSGNLNVLESYTLGVVAGPRRGSAPTMIGTSFTKPADNVGVHSYGGAGGYATYAKSFISTFTVPNCAASDANQAKVFVGQRAESFAVNLGPTFDLIDAPAGIVTDGLDPAHYGAVPNPIAKKNVTSIELELPRDCITQSATQPIIGAWTTASVRQARVINPAATYGTPSHEGGAWTQVSRLSNPLVNEVVIGLPDKDKFNGSEPQNDAKAGGFATYVTNPTLPAVIDLIFSTSFQPTVFPRTDLVAAFLTGVAPVNAFPVSSTPATAEYIRLNTNTEGLVDTVLNLTPGTTKVAGGAQFRLGAALCVVAGVVTPTNPGCDPFGFPNGRRPSDDVVDLALDVMEGYLLASGNPAYTGTGANQPVFFTDGVDQAATPFDTSFPYLTTPTQGANGDGT